MLLLLLSICLEPAQNVAVRCTLGDRACFGELQILRCAAPSLLPRMVPLVIACTYVEMESRDAIFQNYFLP